MDLLCSRYASPFSFIDSMLKLGTFSEGVRTLVEQDNEKKMWELYLHSNPYIAPHKSFADWKNQVNTNTQHSKALSKEEVKATVEMSQNILNNFQMKVGE